MKILSPNLLTNGRGGGLGKMKDGQTFNVVFWNPSLSIIVECTTALATPGLLNIKTLYLTCHVKFIWTFLDTSYTLPNISILESRLPEL